MPPKRTFEAVNLGHQAFRPIDMATPSESDSGTPDALRDCHLVLVGPRVVSRHGHLLGQEEGKLFVSEAKAAYESEDMRVRYPGKYVRVATLLLARHPNGRPILRNLALAPGQRRTDPEWKAYRAAVEAQRKARR